MKVAFYKKWTKTTIMPSTENTKERNRHTVLLDYKMIKGGCCCLFFWLGGVHYHEKKELVKVFNKNRVEITILSHLRSIDDRTYTTSQIIVDGEVQDEKLIETNMPEEEVADFEKEWEENCNDC